MCAIVDTSALGDLWEDGHSEAGIAFRRWIEGPRGMLVLGGYLTEEYKSKKANRWIRELRITGKVKIISDADVNKLTDELMSLPKGDQQACKSNDHHVIALALISRTRLLFANDKDLHHDFKNGALMQGEKGTIYSTIEDKTFNRRRRDLLRRQSCSSS